MTTTARATTCGALATTSPELAELGCKRLPRHKGDHRTTLHQPRVTSARTSTTKGRRVSKAGLKRLAVKLAAAVETGTMKPSVAMARYAAYVTRLASKRTARVTTAAA